MFKKTLKSVSKNLQKRIETLFKLHDINSNGYIEKDELRKITKILQDLDGKDLEEKINEDLKKLDLNGDSSNY
jgi:Ca2+-binding EF-hand superfamily protein